MESRGAQAGHLKQVFLVACVVGLAVLIGFSIRNYVRGNMQAMWIHVLIALIVAVGIAALLLGKEARNAFRVVLFGVGVGMLCLTAFVQTYLFYPLGMPLLFFFFLGRREGGILTGAFFTGMAVLLLAHGYTGSLVYETELGLRFLAAYLFVSLIGWGHETSSQRLFARLVANNEQLESERKHLKHALEKITDAEVRLEQTVAEMRDRTQLMETVFDNMDEGIVVSDGSGKLLLFNPSAKRILGLGPVDAKPDEWSDVYGAFYLDKETRVPTDQLPLVRALAGESTDRVEFFVRNDERKDGIYVSAKGLFIPSDNGADEQVKAGIAIFSDITRYKRQEADLQETIGKLKKQALLMETVFRSVSDGVVVTGSNGEFLFVNPGAEDIVGMGPTDSPSEEWSETYGTFYPDGVTPFPSEKLPLMRAMRGEVTDDVELFIRNQERPDGVFISVSGRPLQDDSGVIEGGVIVFRDVTERRLADEALSQAFTQGRLEIVDTILHNIGNAINSVATGIGTIHGELTKNELVHRLSALAAAIVEHRDDWISYLSTDPQGQKVMPFILGLARDFTAQNTQLTQTVERVEIRVAHIVDIIRTQRSIDTGALARKDINLRKAISDVTKLLQDSLGKRGVHIHVDCGNAPEEIRIQESKFHQMLVNLIKNAIEAIDDLEKTGGLQAKPRIGIRSYVQEDYLVIDVIDNGIGIEEKRINIIFAAGYTTKEVGSGLGLHSIANFIIGSGGQIYPVSAGTGKGTTMRVKLRLASVAPKSESEEREPQP